MTVKEMLERINEDYCEADGCDSCPLNESKENEEHFCGYRYDEPEHDAKLPGDYAMLYGNPAADPVNSPDHYKMAGGVEVIQITEHLNFCRGNAVKYLCRAGKKDPAKELEDLKKAQWYVNREIQRLEQK